MSSASHDTRSGWRPTHQDPLFIMAMDHRDSFGSKLFGVAKGAEPDAEQTAAMESAKGLIADGLAEAAGRLATGRPGILVDEQYGQAVVDRAKADDALVLAVPIEASGQEWFTLLRGDDWLEHLVKLEPDYAKVLVRDNPQFDPERRQQQLQELGRVSAGLAEAGIPLLLELLVPATHEQLQQVGGDEFRYDRDLRPQLVVQVLADTQAYGVRPALWKVEGLETVPAAQAVADQAVAGPAAGRRSSPSGAASADGAGPRLIVLGRDAPTERLDHWLEVASSVEQFVGFAIGRSIWEGALGEFTASDRGPDAAGLARSRIADRYLGFTRHWRT
jgi:5-dehydro-2-deoxygluconokinase